MFVRPRLRYNYCLLENADQVLVLDNDTLIATLPSLLYGRIAGLLDGSNNTDEIVEAVSPELEATHAYFALLQLERAGYTEECEFNGHSFSHEEARYLSLMGTDLPCAVNKLDNTTVGIHALPQAMSSLLQKNLTLLGVRLNQKKPDIWVVVTTDYACTELKEWNLQALKNGHPWMLINVSGFRPSFGPIFEPGSTACWECLSQRLDGRRTVERFVASERGGSYPLRRHSQSEENPSALAVAAGGALEIYNWLLRPNTNQPHPTIVTFEPNSSEYVRHHVIKRPQCPVCGTVIETCPTEINLDTAKNMAPGHQGYHLKPTDELLDQLNRHISPVCGIISKIGPPRNWSNADNHHIHLYECDHIWNIDPPSTDILIRNAHSGAGGKGRTQKQARAGAICEALERYSGMFFGTELVRTGSYRQIEPDAIHPRAYLNYSDAQYENRQQINASSNRFTRVPEPFNEEQEISWTPLQNMVNGQTMFLPTACCYYGYREPEKHKTSGPSCWADSNGNAAGSCLEEAILQGFFELVERDAVGIWWYNKIKRPGIPLMNLDDDYLQYVARYYETLGRDVWVLNITSDIEIPVYAAVSSRRSGTSQDIILGFGAHIDGATAISRAVTELNQSLPFISSVGTTDDTNYSHHSKAAIEWWENATLITDPYLAINQTMPWPSTPTFNGQREINLTKEVNRCVDRIAQLGLDFFVLNQTRPDVGLHVVKVVIPGLRHFWPRLAPGRLYDIPVQMGWLKESTPEQAMNVRSIYF